MRPALDFSLVLRHSIASGAGSSKRTATRAGLRSSAFRLLRYWGLRLAPDFGRVLPRLSTFACATRIGFRSSAQWREYAVQFYWGGNNS